MSKAPGRLPTQFLHSLLHGADLRVRKHGELARPLACRKLAVILHAKANEQVDLAIRHVHDLLHRCLALVISNKEFQLRCKLHLDRDFKETEQCLRLIGEVDEAVPRGGFVFYGHAAVVAQYVIRS